MNFTSVLTSPVVIRLDPMSSYELPASEKANAEEVERRGNKKASQDGTQAKKGKCGSSKGSKGSAKSQQRYDID